MRTIDLRSDTVTLPTPAMRRAIAEAPLGDDVYGEDPTINRLEALSAERVGKQAAMLVTSGTMGNLCAILAHCGRGQEAIVGEGSATFPQININLGTVQSDIVIFRLHEGYGTPETFARAVAERGLLIGGIGRGYIRAVTHYGIDAGDIEETLEIVRA